MTNHPGEVVNKMTFAGVFREAWHNTIKSITIINSFKASGICPIDRNAIPPGKLSPSDSFCSENVADEALTGNLLTTTTKSTSDSSGDTSSMYTSDSVPGSNTHLHEQLAKLESQLSDTKIHLFNNRYDNGYDLNVDPVYAEWKYLKDQINRCSELCRLSGSDDSLSSNEVTASVQTLIPITYSPSRKVSPALKAALYKPVSCQNKTKKATGRILHMPKHLTGEAFITLMEEKEKKKEELEKKEKCKLEREEKKKERERLAQEKEKRKKAKPRCQCPQRSSPVITQSLL